MKTNSEKFIYKTAKSDRTFRIIWGAAYFVLFVSMIVPFLLERDSIILMTMAVIHLPIMFLLILLKRISVIIDGNLLIVKVSGIKFYSLEIENILKIKKGETLWVGIHKYGTRTGGLIITAKYKDDLYITPENEAEFLDIILDINPQIIFTEK